MYCNQCGNILTEQGAFCSFCGARNEETAKTDAAQSVPTASETSTPTAAAEQTFVAPPAPFASPVMPSGYTNEVPVTPPPVVPPVKEEKYYTFNHILLCLAAVAVMAIVAGVFAGLYFSVI